MTSVQGFGTIEKGTQTVVQDFVMLLSGADTENSTMC